MPLYMDIHKKVEGGAAADVAGAHCRRTALNEFATAQGNGKLHSTLIRQENQS